MPSPGRSLKLLLASPMTLRSILFDIDGTLVARGRPLPGAIEAVADARRQGLALRFLTNITGRLPSDIAADLRAHGFLVENDDVQTARPRVSTSCRHAPACAVT